MNFRNIFGRATSTANIKSKPSTQTKPASKWQWASEKDKNGIFILKHWVIRKNQNGTARVHLHGEISGGKSFFSDKVRKQIDYVTLQVLPGETDAELVRCAVAASPRTWLLIGFFVNINRFDGKFYTELDERLKATLPDMSTVSSSNNL